MTDPVQMTPLYQELHRWRARPFVWGEMDCITAICDWVLRVRGVDPGAPVRGTYDSRGACQRETGYFRDPVGVIGKLFADVGLARVEVAQPGDVALIVVADVDGRRSPCGALWLGAAWGCKGPHGTTAISPRVVGDPMAIWGVGYAA
jgi:hypothetical protein